MAFALITGALLRAAQRFGPPQPLQTVCHAVRAVLRLLWCKAVPGQLGSVGNERLRGLVVTPHSSVGYREFDPGGSAADSSGKRSGQGESLADAVAFWP